MQPIVIILLIAALLLLIRSNGTRHVVASQRELIATLEQQVKAQKRALDAQDNLIQQLERQNGLLKEINNATSHR